MSLGRMPIVGNFNISVDNGKLLHHLRVKNIFHNESLQFNVKAVGL